MAAKKTPASPPANDGPLTDVTPLDYQNVPMQPRTRPQWDPMELAHKALDDMERRGTLHHQNRRPS
jgi:hypothetical protein